MKRLLVAYILLPLTALGQANAGPDKMVSDNIPATLGVPGDGKSCYSWKAFPADPSMSDPMQPQIVVKPKVPTIYQLTVIGEGFSTKFEDEVLVTPLTIEYFRHSPGQEWKVVVGEPVSYSAKAADGCTDWKWKLGTWTTTGGAGQQGSDLLIPEDKKKLDNAGYGDADGQVEVSCLDPEGTRHVAVAPVKAFVFFRKDEQFWLDVYTKLPNWFHFWMQELPWKPQLNEVVYSHLVSDRDGNYAHIYTETRKAVFGSKAGGVDEWRPGASGIGTLWITLLHEMEHQRLWDLRWPNGHIPALDLDNDMYPDAWEASERGQAAGFMPNRSSDRNDPELGDANPAYRFEEGYCRAREEAANLHEHDHKDWSYDPSGVAQGKQWLKIKVTAPAPDGRNMNAQIAKHP